MKKALFLVLLLIVGVSIIALSGCEENGVPAPTIALPDKTREVSVFYATGRTIVEERHVVKDDNDIVKTTLNEVLAAKPQSNTEIAIVQPECKVLGVRVDKKGLATINFSKEVLDFNAIRKEKLLAYGALLETLKQFDAIKSIKLQVEGREKGTINGKDIRAFWGDVSLIGQPRSIR